MDSDRVLLTPLEAAQFLAISPRKLWTLSQNGEIEVTLIPPRSVRYHIDDLHNFIEHCKQKNQPA